MTQPPRRTAPAIALPPLPLSLTLTTLTMILALGSGACGGDDEPTTDAGLPTDAAIPDAGRPDAAPVDAGTTEPLEIVGVWASNFGTEEVITEDRFNSADIVEYDNAANVLITQSSTTAEFNPGLYNRIEWLDLTGDTFYYCFVDFGLPSAEAARASTMSADPTDPDNGGCGGFPWTRLRRAISIRGRYMSNFGGMETITATAWVQFGVPRALIDWDEADNWVVTQNPESAPFNPSLFGRIEFTDPGSTGSFHYCTVDFGLTTADEARTSTLTADPGELDTFGCGGFPWTRLDPL